MPIKKFKAWREAAASWCSNSLYEGAVRSLTPAPALTDEPERAPWVATIQQHDAHNRVGWHLAAGVLIAPTMVLTCAHPFRQEAQSPGTVPQADRTYSVRIGGSGLDDGTLHEATEVITHPDFNMRTSAHDMAIVVIAPGTDAPPLCLDLVPTKVGDPAIVLGWPDGRDGDGRLTRARTTIIDPRIAGAGATLCLANLAFPHAIRPGYSGGPVVSLRDDVPRVCGVLSAGAQDVRVNGFGEPAVAIAVATETDFIDNVLRASAAR